jgi:hypothetical protein
LKSIKFSTFKLSVGDKIVCAAAEVQPVKFDERIAFQILPEAALGEL